MNIHTNKLKNKDRVDKNLFYLYFQLQEYAYLCENSYSVMQLLYIILSKFFCVSIKSTPHS